MTYETASDVLGTEIINLTVKKNPKRPINKGETAKSYQRFNLYKNGMTVNAYLKAAAKFSGNNNPRKWVCDILYDINHGYIELSNPNK